MTLRSRLVRVKLHSARNKYTTLKDINITALTSHRTQLIDHMALKKDNSYMIANTETLDILESCT